MYLLSCVKAAGIFALVAQATPKPPKNLSPTGKRTAQAVIDKLGLIPNEEKGYYVETFQDAETNSNRSVSTAIYYLLEGSVGPRSGTASTL
ncbi:cupin family protein [Colletotrichum tofieldiae]|nr:cupin family protein [Colletotrichum tofieldiae]